MSIYVRMLMERLAKPDSAVPLRPDQLRDAFRYAGLEGAESVHGATTMAYLLFMIIREQHGDRAARRIFAKWGKPPSRHQLQIIANMGLLDRLDMMEPEPNVQRLARELAEENRTLPRDKRRGAGSTNKTALEKQINRARDWRKDEIEKGTWLGPFPPDGDPGDG